eukprot:103878-Chlamydomonas_euryale.AAC.1
MHTSNRAHPRHAKFSLPCALLTAPRPPAAPTCAMLNPVPCAWLAAPGPSSRTNARSAASQRKPGCRSATTSTTLLRDSP